MVIRVFVSGSSGNKEVKKRQQRVTMILDGKNIDYTVIDIAEPGSENDKEFMQENSKPRDSKYALPPQIFNGDTYCGDYEDFDMANELDELEKFLSLGQDNGSNSIVENGVRNETKLDSTYEGLRKEDSRESAQEPVDTVSKTEPETVTMSIGNEIESSEPDETPNTLGDSPKEFRDSSNNLDASSEEDLTSSFPKNDELENDPRTDEDEVSKESVQHESLNDVDVGLDSENDEDSVDTDSEN